MLEWRLFPCQNTIDRASNPNNDSWAQHFDGFRFDEGFEPDFMLILRHGASGDLDVDFAEIGNPAVGSRIARVNYRNPPSTGPFPASNGIVVGFDNSNKAGVGGGGAADQTAALAIETGFELGIPLALIGDPDETIGVSAFINGARHDFLSNQFLCGLEAGAGNLGTNGLGSFVANSPLAVDLNDYSGDQFFGVDLGAIAAPDKASVSNVAISRDRIAIVIEDVGKSLVDPATVTLTLDGSVEPHDHASWQACLAHPP